MAKLPGRIPAESVRATSGWNLPEISGNDGSQTIRLLSSESKGKLRRRGSADLRSNAGSVRAPNKISGVEQSETDLSKTINSKTINSKTISSKTSQDLDSPLSNEGGNVDSGSQAFQSEHPSAARGENGSQHGGREQGYEDGFKKGEADGLLAGEKAGYEAGLEAGTAAGTIAGTEAGREEGVQAGNVAGHEAAKAAFDEEVASQREILANLVRGFSEPPAYDENLALALADLVSELTKAVVMGEVQTQPQHIERLVAQALTALPNHSGTVRVYVHQDDLVWLQETINPDVELVADKSLARGGCRVETSDSRVEGTIAERIRAALTASKVVDREYELTERDLQHYAIADDLAGGSDDES